jgi:hypothetical protein
MHVREARTPADLKRFIDLPRALYAEDPLWVPPLWMDERGAYSPRTNAILARSEHALLLAEDGGRVVGRSLVYVDAAFNAYYRTRMGMFGAFECVNDPAAARALDDHAVAWLRARGMDRVRGPIHPVSESWGFIVDGFSAPPVFMSPYNPPWYNDLVAPLGYRKAKDLLVYEGLTADYQIPRRFAEFSARLLGPGTGLSVRPLSLKNLTRDADAVLEISNAGLADNWGYVPVGRDEFQDVFRKLKAIVDPEAVWFVEDRGRPVGYALGFPDLNVVLKRTGGRLLPFGFIDLLWGVRKVRDYRLFGLALLPEYRGKALDVLLYMQLFVALSGRIDRMEANYILEDNWRIRNALEKLRLRRVRTYRVYEKGL